MSLVPFDPKGFTANFSTATKKLTVTAVGTLPAPFVACDFKQDDEFSGGRLLRFLGSMGGGAGPVKPSQITKTWVDTVTAPPVQWKKYSIVYADLTSKKETTVSVPYTIDAPAPTPAPVPAPIPVPATGGPVQPVPVQPVPVQPAPVPSAGGPLQVFVQTPSAKPTDRPKSDPTAILLREINVLLAAKDSIRVVAQIPDPALFRSTIEARFEGEALCIWRSGQAPGQLYWDVAWAAAGVKDTTFLVTVMKTPLTPANAKPVVTVQGFPISWVARQSMVDLFDPDA